MSEKDELAQQPIQLYTTTTPQKSLGFGKPKGVQPQTLTDFADKIRKSVPAGLEWEVTVEGSLEVGTGSFWPGATAGFKASLTLNGKT